MGKFVVSQNASVGNSIKTQPHHCSKLNLHVQFVLHFAKWLKGVLKHRLAYVHNCKLCYSLCYSWSLQIQWLKPGIKNPTRVRPIHFADIVERGQIRQSTVGVENPIQQHLKVIAPNYFQMRLFSLLIAYVLNCMRVFCLKLADLVTKTKYCKSN